MNNRTQILLNEYEHCQQHVHFNASRYWTVTNIVTAINTALLVGAATAIIKVIPSFQGVDKWLTFLVPVLILGLGIGMIIIIITLKQWLKRVNFLIYIGYRRMHEIEAELGMLKNLTIHWLDNPNEVPDEQRGRLETLKNSRYAPPKESSYVRFIYKVLISLWGFAILVSIAVAIVSFLANNG